MADMVIIAVLALVVGLIVRGMIRDKKAGKSSCGGNCGDCGLCKFAVPLDRKRELIKGRCDMGTVLCPTNNHSPY